MPHDHPTPEIRFPISELHLQASGNYDTNTRAEPISEAPRVQYDLTSWQGVKDTLTRIGNWLRSSSFMDKAYAGARVAIPVLLIGGAAYALAGDGVQKASADVINPLTVVQSASPTDTVYYPLEPDGVTPTYGNGTGAGGNTLSNTWFVSTDKNGTGYLLQYDGKTFQNAILVGLPSLTGVDVNPDGSLILSSGSSLYHGRIVGGAWQQDAPIGLGKILNDVCTGYGMADYFVAATDGVWAVRGGALGEQVESGNYQSYDVVRLDPAMYTK